MSILISDNWGDKPTTENFEKHGIVPLKIVDAGMYARNKHTYTYNGQLYCGKGYAWRETYSPDRDHVMMDDVTGMSLEELKAIHPVYEMSKENKEFEAQHMVSGTAS